MRGSGGSSCRFERIFYIFLWAMQHIVTGLDTARGGEHLAFAYPFRKKICHFWNSLFGTVLTPFLVERLRGVERAGKPKNQRCCPPVLTLSCWARRDRHFMPTHVKYCWRSVEKSLILRTQWMDRWMHGGCTMGACR